MISTLVFKKNSIETLSALWRSSWPQWKIQRQGKIKFFLKKNMKKNQSFFRKKERKSVYNNYKKHIHIENFCKDTLIWKFLNFVHIKIFVHMLLFFSRKKLLYIHCYWKYFINTFSSKYLWKKNIFQYTLSFKNLYIKIIHLSIDYHWKKIRKNRM